MNQSDGNLFIKYNPYTVETIIRFDALDEDQGDEPKESSDLYRSRLKGKRLQEWIDKLPCILKTSGREKSYTITFHGTTLDYEDVKAVAETSAIITNCEHIKACDPDDKINHLKQLFEDACKLGIISNNGYEKVVNEVFNTGFEAYVVATMSAGKSTLINALLRQKLMPSRNEACTAIITRICDLDSNMYSGRAYGGKDESLRETITELTYETMERLNSDDNITNVVIEGKIPFVNSKGIPFVIVDTPGPNNNRNPDHRLRTMSEIKSGKQSLIIFLLDASQNGTDSEHHLIEDIAKSMKQSGKMSRDRFLFVITKVDNYWDEPDNINGLLESNHNGLEKFGIDDPRIYPISATVALAAATGTDKASRMERTLAETIIETPQMHLEQAREGINSHIPVSAREKIEVMLSEAKAKSDLDTQALIHSGIPSLEAAMTEYIEKYAHAIRVGEIARNLQSKLNSADMLTELNLEVMTDGKKRDAILAAIAEMEPQIKSGKQGAAFARQIVPEFQDALKVVAEEIEKIKREISDDVITYCGKNKDDRLTPVDAMKIYSEWENKFKHMEDELKLKLSDLLNKCIKERAAQFLDSYRKSVEKLIPKNEIGELPFDPLILLDSEMTIDCIIDDFISKERKYQMVKDGTRKNPERNGWGVFQFWLPREVDNFKPEFYTEEFVDWKKFGQDFMGKVRANITMCCQDAQTKAQVNSEKMVDDFKGKFDFLNQKLMERTANLKEMSQNDQELDIRIAHNKQKIKDVELLQERLNSILLI